MQPLLLLEEIFRADFYTIPPFFLLFLYEKPQDHNRKLPLLQPLICTLASLYRAPINNRYQLRPPLNPRQALHIPIAAAAERQSLQSAVDLAP